MADKVIILIVFTVLGQGLCPTEAWTNSTAEQTTVPSTPTTTTTTTDSPPTTTLQTRIPETESFFEVKPKARFKAARNVARCGEGYFTTYYQRCYGWFSYIWNHMEHTLNCEKYNMKLMTIDNEEIFRFLPNLVNAIIEQKKYAPEMRQRNAGTEYYWWTNVKGAKLYDGKTVYWNVDNGVKTELDLPTDWLDTTDGFPGASFGLTVRIRFMENNKFSLKLVPADPDKFLGWALCQKKQVQPVRRPPQNKPADIDTIGSSRVQKVQTIEAHAKVKVEEESLLKTTTSEKKNENENPYKTDDNGEDVDDEDEDVKSITKSDKSKIDSEVNGKLSQSIVNENNIGESGDRTLMMIVGGGGLMCLVISTVFVCFWGSSKRNFQCAPAPQRQQQEEIYQRSSRSESPEPSPSITEIPDIMIDPKQLRRTLELARLSRMGVMVCQQESKA